MHNSHNYNISTPANNLADGNNFNGVSIGSNYGVIATNTGPTSSRVSFNYFDNLYVGTQTEQDNQLLKINCNKYSNTNFGWAVNPASPSGSLAQQGSGLFSFDKQAGNEFYDIPICTPGSAADHKHILSSLDVTYFAYGTSSFGTIEPTCISDILYDNGGFSGDVHYCGASFPDQSCAANLLRCATQGCLDTLLADYYAETDTIEKNEKQKEIVRYYLGVDSTDMYSSAIAFLDTMLNDKDAAKLLLPLYMQVGNTDSARIIIDSLRTWNLIDQCEDTLYSIALSLIDSGKTWFEMDSTQEAKVTAIVDSASNAHYTAQVILEAVRGNKYDWYPEEINDARLASPHQNAVNDETIAYSAISVSPNPFTESTAVSYQLSDSITQNTTCSLKIYDVLGNIIKSFNVKPKSKNGIFTLSLKEFNQGIYFCHLIVDDKIIDSRKLLMIK